MVGVGRGVWALFWVRWVSGGEWGVVLGRDRWESIFGEWRLVNRLMMPLSNNKRKNEKKGG